MKSIKQIEIRFARVIDNCPMGTKIFCGKDADVLAANYQSAHPELKEEKKKKKKKKKKK